MTCKKCGVLLRKDAMHCDYCGLEVRLVPDYQANDDQLETRIGAGMKKQQFTTSSPSSRHTQGYSRVSQKSRYGSVSRSDTAHYSTIQFEQPKVNMESKPYYTDRTEQLANVRKTPTNQPLRSGSNQSQRNGSNQSQRNGSNQSQRNGSNQSNNPGSGKGNSTTNREKVLRKRRLAEKRKAQKQKRMLMFFVFIAVALLLASGVSYVVYKNSYVGIIADAVNYTNNKEYNKAISTYNKAILRDPDKELAYLGLGEIYVLMDDIDLAQELYETGVKNNPDNVNMYIMLFDFYVDSKQGHLIMPIIEKCQDETLLLELEHYIVDAVEFSLEESEYEDVQELSLSSLEDTIYYTLDGSEVNIDSEIYSEPIQISEGTTKIQAMAYSEGGIPSVIVSREYTVELPVEGAPVVSPSTGQYDSKMEINVQVPQGYTAYYTLDGSVPSEESTAYVDAIEMPKGNTIFSVVLINKNGKISEVTKRNYELVIN